MIIRDPSPPFKHDGELLLTISDWYQTQAPYLVDYYQSVENTEGAEPIPDTGLLNDGQDIKLKVDPGKTYFLRTINIGGFVGGYIEIEDHEFVIVEVDGLYTQPMTVKRLYLSVAQRYGVLLKTKSTRSKNYLIRGQLDTGKPKSSRYPSPRPALTATSQTCLTQFRMVSPDSTSMGTSCTTLQAACRAKRQWLTLTPLTTWISSCRRPTSGMKLRPFRMSTTRWS